MDQAAENALLAKLRERYRGRFPDQRLILLVDRRGGYVRGSHVVVVERSSDWYPLLPPEQVGELFDRERSN